MAILARSSTRIAPSRSATLAAVTSTTISRPMVSTTRCRLRPLVFLPASQPREPRPTVDPPGTVWESTAPAGDRRALHRAASEQRIAPGGIADRVAQRSVDAVDGAVWATALEVEGDG